MTTKPVDQYLCMYVFIFSYISLNKDLQFRFRKKNNSLTFVKLLKILELSNFWDKKLISRRAVDAKDATRGGGGKGGGGVKEEGGGEGGG